MIINNRKAVLAAVPAFLALLGAVQIPASAQTGILHRHPIIAGAAAGLAAHHMAKKAGRGRMAHGGRPNFAERHPMMTGIAAGAAAHHMLKRH